MESGRLIFNAPGSGAGQMLFLDCGAAGGPGGGGLFHRGINPIQISLFASFILRFRSWLGIIVVY